MTASALSASTRAEHDHQQRGADEVERALDDVVEALEDRRAQLEQRQRLAGHEVRALGEDLHRRRRDPHAHAALVAVVDELDSASRSGNAGSAMITSSMPSRSMISPSSSSVPSERIPLSGRGVSEMKPTTSIDGVARSAWPTASRWSLVPTSTARRW